MHLYQCNSAVVAVASARAASAHTFYSRTQDKTRLWAARSRSTATTAQRQSPAAIDLCALINTQQQNTMIGIFIMQLELSFLFLKKRFKVHWDNGWVTSNQDRFFDVESAARFECVSYLALTGRSPDDFKKQLTNATASARDRATVGLFGR